MTARVGVPRLPTADELAAAARQHGELDGRTLAAALLVRSAEPGSVLDVGCKGGWLLRFLVGEPWAGRLVGVDLDAAELASSGSPVIVGDARRLPVGDARFDAVTLFDVIEHVPVGTEPEVLEGCRRALRPGGLLFLSTPADWLLGSWLDPARWLAGHRHYARQRIRALIEGAGLVVVLAATRGAWADLIGLPVLYATSRLGMAVPFRERFRSWANREYGRPGRYTHFVVARNP